MHDNLLIESFQEKITEIYRTQDLKSLSINGTYEYNNRQILAWYFNVVETLCNKERSSFLFNQIFDDLVFCSDQLIYFTAHLYLYRPFINDPIANGHEFYGKMIYPNNQNIYGKRYDIFSDVCYQSTYNYWDRIGDLLAMSFPHTLKERSINFSSVINAIAPTTKNSKHYDWLKNFMEMEYVGLNNSRKQIVHYTSSSIRFKYQHISQSSDRSFIEKHQNERLRLAIYFKNHSEFALLGFEHAVALLEEYSNII